MSSPEVQTEPEPSGVPTRHELLAALTAARLISPAGTPVVSAHVAYTQHPSQGLLGVADMSAGEALLVRTGLLKERGDVLTPTQDLLSLLEFETDIALELLLARAIETDPPGWLAGAVDGNVVQWELVSSADERAIESVLLDLEDRERLLLALGNRVDVAVRNELGQRGEDHVVADCRRELIAAERADLVERVRRVSLISDQLGYDVVAPTPSGCPRRLEVKTVGATKGLRIFLTRNEASVGLRDPAWALVVVRALPEGDEIAGWCRGAEIEPLLPRDQTQRGRWASVELNLPRGLLLPGLPTGAEKG